MARNDGVDRTVVREAPYRRSGIGVRERHNERKNESYSNPDIVRERSELNVHFKQPDASYESILNHMLNEKIVSDRGLRPDAKVFGELVFDVNTRYFDERGGYDFAKEFFAEAYRCAVGIVGGEQYVVSAVMHADERNRGLSDELGRDVYHCHLHVVYIPVVIKEVLWSKRCKDPALRGTVKERIVQISHSKKWKSEPMLDDEGRPVIGSNGKPVLQNSYSILQDMFFDHMENAGYYDLQRGERGSDDVHLSVLQLKTKLEQERLEALGEQREEAEEALSSMQNQQTEKEDTLRQLEAKAAQTEKRLDKLTPKLENVEEFVKHNIHSPDEVLPKADTFESGKRYREDRAVPAVSRLQKALLALYQKFINLKQEFQDLWRRCTSAERSRDYYKQQTEALSAENYHLSKSARDLERVRRALGSEAVDNAIEWAADLEMADALSVPAGRNAPARSGKSRSDRDAR